MNFQSAVRVSWEIPEYKTDADIKEVTILDVFPKLHLLLTITLHPHHGRWCPIVFPPSGALDKGQKVCIPGVVRNLLPELTYPQWNIRLPMVHLMQVTKGLPDMVTKSEVLI